MSAITFHPNGREETIENPTSSDWKRVLTTSSDFLLGDYIKYTKKNGGKADLEVIKSTLRYFNTCMDDRNYKSLSNTDFADNSEVIQIVCRVIPSNVILEVVGYAKVQIVALQLLSLGCPLKDMAEVKFEKKNLNDIEQIVFHAVKCNPNNLAAVSERYKANKQLASIAASKSPSQAPPAQPTQQPVAQPVSTPASVATAAPAKAPANTTPQQVPPAQLAATFQNQQMVDSSKDLRRSNFQQQQQAQPQLQPHIPRSVDQPRLVDDDKESEGELEPKGFVSSCISYLMGCWNSIFSWFCSCFNS